MKIGAIAQRLSTTVRTLRFYEERGLVHPRRTAGGTRVYDERDVQRFAALLALARLGFSLQEIAELAAIRMHSRTGAEASRAVSARLARMDAALADRAEVIRTRRRDIALAQQVVDRCRACDQPPRRAVCDRCPVSAPVDQSQTLQVIWDEPVRE
jgi:DNA-binding transcriptional MerR regulator